MKRILSVGFLALLASCAQVNQISDDQLAADLSAGTKAAVKYSLSFASKKYPAEAARIQADALALDSAIQKVVIPSLSGADTATVARAAIDVALTQLKSKITNERVLDTIGLVENAILTELPLPKNPADKLSPRIQKAVSAIFSGASAGIEAAYPPPPSPTPAPNK